MAEPTSYACQDQHRFGIIKMRHPNLIQLNTGVDACWYKPHLMPEQFTNHAI